MKNFDEDRRAGLYYRLWRQDRIVYIFINTPIDPHLNTLYSFFMLFVNGYISSIETYSVSLRLLAL